MTFRLFKLQQQWKKPERPLECCVGMQNLSGEALADYFKVSPRTMTFVLILGSNDCLNDTHQDMVRNICRILMKVHWAAPNATFFIADIPLQPGQEKYHLAQWVNAQLVRMLVGRMETAGVMFEVRSVVPIHWGHAVEELEKYLKTKSDAITSTLEVWEPFGIHVGLTGCEVLMLEMGATGTIIQAAPGTGQHDAWEKSRGHWLNLA